MMKTVRLSAGGSGVGFGGLQTQPDVFSGDDPQPTQALHVDDGTVKNVAVSSAAAAAAVFSGVEGSSVEACGPALDDGAGPQAAHDVWSGMAQPKRRLAPMEQLTGMAHDRPEIIAIMPFKPAFTDPPPAGKAERLGQTSAVKTSRYTDVGRFIESRRRVTRLRHAVSARVVATAAAGSPALRSEIDRRAAAVVSELDALSDSSAFMLGVARAMVKLRGQLDLRDDVHRVDPQRVFAQHVVPTGLQGFKQAFDGAFKVHGAYAPGSYGVVDVMQRLGYDQDTARSTFTSSKLWLQLVHDLREAVRDHSLEFADLPDTQRRQDRSPAVIGKLAGVKYFRISTQLKALPSVADICGQDGDADLSRVVALVDEGYRTLYDGTQFRTEESRIAALVHIVAREHRYSVGLGQADVVRTLRERFGFQASPGTDNSSMFDAVFGTPGASVTDVPTQFPGSLTALAHRQVEQDGVVLTFESRYLETGVGTFTPGSAYHVDGVMEVTSAGFRTARLDELATSLSGALDRFSRVMSGLDLLASGRPSAAGPVEETVSGPLALLEATVGRVVDMRTGHAVPDVANDPVSVVYAAARDDTRLRALLFLLAVARLAQAEGGGLVPSFERLFGPGKPRVVEHLIDRVVARLLKKAHATNAVVLLPGITDTSIPLEALKTALRSGSSSVKIVDNVMAATLHAFVDKDRGLVDGKTRYSGLQDTVVLMLAFDIMCAAMHAYSGKKIVGESHVMPGTQFETPCLVLGIDRSARLGSVTTIRSRLQREVALVGQLVCTIVAVMANLASSAVALTNHLGSQGSRAALARITAVVGGERLRALCTEQQVMLLAAAVSDLVTVARRTADPGAIVHLDAPGSSQHAAALVEAALGDSEFALGRGYNKRIITVGLPHGIAERLRQVVDLRTVKQGGFRTRQADLIRIVVHKVDVQMGDLVFRPLSFMFELSRFPVRDPALHLPLPDGAGLRHAIACLPSRDFGASEGPTMTYPDPRDLDLPGQTSRALTFSDPDHGFLARPERRELLRNHALSYLLETYVRLLTGLSLADHLFDVDEQAPTLTPAFVAQLLAARADVVGTASARREVVPTSSTGLLAGRRVGPGAVPVPQRAQETKAALAFDARDVAVRDAATVAGLARELTSISDPLVISRRLLAPKQFDRVFSVVVDPDEFEVDVDATSRTAVGRQALESLRRMGEVVPVPASTAERLAHGRSSVHEPLRLRSRDRGAGDMAFERYFVTVEPAFGAR
jgi:hypothetical protein